MPQGFKNSPAIFQMIMDKMLKEYLDTACCVYLDDIIIFGETEEEHDANLSKILSILEKNKFKVNIDKIQYKLNKIKILGAIIDGVKQYPIDIHQRKIKEFNTPTTKKEVQRFLGFANYYRRYLKNFSMNATPLYESLKGKATELK